MISYARFTLSRFSEPTVSFSECINNFFDKISLRRLLSEAVLLPALLAHKKQKSTA